METDNNKWTQVKWYPTSDSDDVFRFSNYNQIYNYRWSSHIKWGFDYTLGTKINIKPPQDMLGQI